MLGGHEDCPAETVTYGTVANPKMYVQVTCEHMHTYGIDAYDGFDTGPVVAYHCECCGHIWSNEDYVRGK